MADRDYPYDPHFNSTSDEEEDYPMDEDGQQSEPESIGSPSPNTFFFTDKTRGSNDRVSDRARPHFHCSNGALTRQNTHNLYQSSPGPTRTGHTSNWGFEGTLGARATDRWPCLKVGPSTPAPPRAPKVCRSFSTLRPTRTGHTSNRGLRMFRTLNARETDHWPYPEVNPPAARTSHVGPPKLRPMREVIPETTANARINQLTDKNVTLVSDFYRFHDPRVTGRSA